MIEASATVLEDDDSLHSNILYALLLAINLNIANDKLNMAQGKEDVDTMAIQALTTSIQISNVLSMSAALTMCARSLIVSKVIDFDKQFEAMWNTHPDIAEQLTKEKCKEFFVGYLDIDSNSIVLNS